MKTLSTLFARALLLGAAALAGCGGSSSLVDSTAPLQVGPLSVRSVSWGSSDTAAGNVAALAEDGGITAVFGDKGAVIFTTEVQTAADATITAWKAAAAIPAADGDGTWIAAIDGKGQLYRLRDESEIEPVSDLFGLESQAINEVASLGGASTAFSYDGGVAVADGKNVTRFPGAFGHLAGGGGHLAGASDKSVFVLNPATSELVTYPLAGVTAIAVSSAGTVYAETAEGLYAATGGQLAPRYKSASQGLHGLAAAGDRLWFMDGTEIVAIEKDSAGKTSGKGLPATATLRGSPSGDAWILDAGKLSRFAPDHGESDDELLWEKNVQPIFAHRCTPCHAPGGSSGFDLSTYDAWVAKRSVIHERVTVKKTMPPSGVTLEDADRAAIEAWVSAAPK